jgi:hypothetical protein
VTALSFSYSLLPVVPGQEEEKTPVRFAVEIVQQQTFSSSFFNFFLPPPPLSPCSWKWHLNKKEKKGRARDIGEGSRRFGNRPCMAGPHDLW